MNSKTRPYLRDCPFCHASGSDNETILFTMEYDVVEEFAYGYTIRCCSCGAHVDDEYETDAVNRWNGVKAEPFVEYAS